MGRDMSVVWSGPSHTPLCPHVTDGNGWQHSKKCYPDINQDESAVACGFRWCSQHSAVSYHQPGTWKRPSEAFVSEAHQFIIVTGVKYGKKGDKENIHPWLIECKTGCLSLCKIFRYDICCHGDFIWSYNLCDPHGDGLENSSSLSFLAILYYRTWKKRNSINYQQDKNCIKLSAVRWPSSLIGLHLMGVPALIITNTLFSRTQFP